MRKANSNASNFLENYRIKSSANFKSRSLEEILDKTPKDIKASELVPKFSMLSITKYESVSCSTIQPTIVQEDSNEKICDITKLLLIRYS